MQVCVVYEKNCYSRRISGRSPFVRSIIAYTIWADDRLRYKQDPLNGSCLWRKPTTIRRRQVLQKVQFLTPDSETSKVIATKSGETEVRDRALPLCKFSHQSTRDNYPRAKIHLFLYRGLRWGLQFHAIHFVESSGRTDFKL